MDEDTLNAAMRILNMAKSAGEPREIEQAHGYAWRLHGDHLG